MKKILITGANSYIGTSFEKYMEQFGNDYSIDTVDMIGDSWKSKSFSGYDCVFHVAGIAHQKETLENAHLYYEVNRNLAIATAKKAKREGVKQFILLSSMSVYGVETGVITKETIPHPKSHYGKSKLQADEKIVKLDCASFKVAILRPPMVYGKDCKGNYQRLRTFALKSPIFPDYPNKRSMVYIGNLCAFVKKTIDEEKSGLFFPQNAEYVNTSKMVKEIAEENGKHIRYTKLFNPFIKILSVSIVKKVFGNLIYDKTDTIELVNELSSIRCSEKTVCRNEKTIVLLSNEHSWTYNLRKETIAALLEKGYKVILILPYGEKIDLLTAMGCEFIDLPIFERRGKNPIKELKLIIQYYKLLKSIRPDIVLTYTIKPNLYGGFVSSLLRIPYIANITGLGSAVEKKGFFQIATKILYKLGLKNAKCVFAQNAGNKDYLIKNRIINKHRVKQIPGSGVNLDRFTTSEYPDDTVCKFVFISRLLKEKGIEDYIAAAKEVKKKYPTTEFHVCGFCEEEYKNRLSRLEMDKYVIYHGMIDDVPDFLKGMHCLVHPSYYLEGTSNVCLEACASGRPVITTDHEGCRETIKNEITGFLVPIKNSKVLAETMIRFIELPYTKKEQMGMAARSYVKANFDRRIVVNAYLKEIEKL